MEDNNLKDYLKVTFEVTVAGAEELTELVDIAVRFFKEALGDDE